jgi:type II secretory pathway pseudopilin PulG
MDKNIATKGFGLVEVLLSIALFALVVTGLMSVLAYTTTSIPHNNNYSDAIRLASEGVDAVRNTWRYDPTLINIGISGVDKTNGILTLGSFPDVVGIFTRTITIQKSDPLLVTVTIDWNEASGQANSFTLESLVTYWQRP